MSTAVEAAPNASEPAATFHEITETVAAVAERRQMPLAWYIALCMAVCLLSLLVISVYHLFMTGIGIYGNNNVADWAWPITNFVFWVGIGHAGTLISAILYLMRQKWRTSINRSAEAMTIFAVMCAAMFPLIHLGRPWFVYFTIPYPSDMGIWPQFRSPLMWDVFAVSTYFTVSVLFWYMGLVPDIATFRDRAKTKIKSFVYGILALGWRGSSRQWHRYERTYLILAALATPLVLSVHSVVSFDFAVSQLPGWHETIFPPYFVAGAIYSGFAMVLTLMIPARYLFGLKDIVKESHIEAMCKITLATGSLVGFSYVHEYFLSWYSGNIYERFEFWNRLFGPYWWGGWIMITCNALAPQLFWFKRWRKNPWLIFIVCVLANIGMWTERFVIFVQSLSRPWLPSSWGYMSPTRWDIMTLLGSFGLFFTLYLLFIRFLPVVAMSEVKGAHPAAHAGAHPPAHADGGAASSSEAREEETNE